MKYTPESEIPEECNDFAFWEKRFSFAFWLFLVVMLAALIVSQPRVAALSLTASIFWLWAGVHLTYRHMKWHIENKSNGKHQ